MLILVVPLQSSPQRQRLQVYLWTGVIMIIYSVLVSLFRVKNKGKADFPAFKIGLIHFISLGYPFKLFL